MQHINSFWLHDTILFKNLKFEIPKGLSVIYGLNRTTGPKSMQANGAGKSSAFSSIRETLYEEPMVGLKEDLLKHGTRGVSMTLKDKKVEIVRKNSKLEIIVNGKPKEFRKKSDGQLWLKKNLPLSSAEFDTYAFLDARVPHPLVMGSSADRKKFFVSAFGLDKIDVERKLFEAELAKLKEVKASYKALRETVDSDKEQLLSKEKRIKLESDVKKLRMELEALQAKASRMQEVNRLLDFERTAYKQLAYFDKFLPDDDDLERFSVKYKHAKQNLEDDKKKLQDARDWADYQKDCRKYEASIKEFSDDARKLLNKKGLKDALRKSKNSRKEYEELKEQKESYERLLAKKPSRPEVLDLSQTPQDSRKELRARLDSLEHKLEHAEKFGGGVCDSCGQSVKTVDPKKLKRRIKDVEADLEKWDQIETYKEQEAEYKEWKSRIKEFDIEQIKEDMAKAKKWARCYKELRDLPTQPKKFKGLRLEIHVMERMVEEDREIISILEFMEPHLDTVRSLRAVTQQQRDKAGLGRKLSDRINEIHELVAKKESRLESNSELLRSLKKRVARMDELKDQLKEEEALKLLVEAYSDKQMKRNAVKVGAARLMKAVNKYAPAVFSEDYKFGFSWESSKVSLTVERKYRKGKKVKVLTSDVRKLSGAESKLFTFLLVFGLLTMTPQHKRSNVLILDEPDAAMSAETTEAFKRLLPILNTVIPSIVVITPRTEQRYEGAREFTVLKRGGEASIVENHPTQIR